MSFLGYTVSMHDRGEIDLAIETIVLVHGAFADGSCCTPVFPVGREPALNRLWPIIWPIWAMRISRRFAAI